MSETIAKLFEKEGGEFVSPPSVFTDKLMKVKMVIFDWDGVFNNGFKKGSEGSIFSEIDAMGTNLLRYALWRHRGALPVTIVLTGENNPSALQLAQRESYHAVYSKMKNKAEAFQSICKTYTCYPEEVLFFLDDVLDFEVARQCGARVMIGRPANVLMKKFVRENKFADYITANDGGHHGLREGAELVAGLLGQFEEVVKNRMNWSEEYQRYLSDRKKIETLHREGEFKI